MITLIRHENDGDVKDYVLQMLRDVCYLGPLILGRSVMNKSVMAIVDDDFVFDSSNLSSGGYGTALEAQRFLASLFFYEMNCNGIVVVIELTLCKKGDLYLEKTDWPIIYVGELPLILVPYDVVNLGEILKYVQDGQSAMSFFAYLLNGSARPILKSGMSYSSGQIVSFCEKVVISACDNEAYLVINA